MARGLGLTKKMGVEVTCDTSEGTLFLQLWAPALVQAVLLHPPGFRSEADTEQGPQPAHDEPSRSERQMLIVLP